MDLSSLTLAHFDFNLSFSLLDQASNFGFLKPEGFYSSVIAQGTLGSQQRGVLPLRGGSTWAHTEYFKLDSSSAQEHTQIVLLSMTSLKSIGGVATALEEEPGATVLDECALGRHSCNTIHGLCVNTLDSFFCACNLGWTPEWDWTPEGDTNCRDVDECTTQVHNCNTANGYCINVWGSFRCNCNVGYTGDGVACNAQMSTLKARYSFEEGEEHLNTATTEFGNLNFLTSSGILWPSNGALPLEGSEDTPSKWAVSEGAVSIDHTHGS
uniref:EGF-like domain-containing protein n=1 Tax=Chromera velia CCMP2878 TaxID=1169474 RepID=A0A0G4HLH4_9ALVE|eukprot:Cvel_28754.t1-p1 / transcript=Cvel_28754.t1 / gene=Cvel_28754 / organism=Chromera_velia_CCMP2878 / gene_product=Fibrillin-2, putative / transcript_product=Fibrillin-2, putative / location=Cvel_scaffold3824:3503-8015(-) / protein_length=267 / sequence_SO=supercontig / SO=protein_coding / is_pseudo=false